MIRPEVQDWQPEWFVKAACLGMEPKNFFPDCGPLAARAKRACMTCPVIEECREYGMDEEYGIWGGLTATERRSLGRGAGRTFITWEEFADE